MEKRIKLEQLIKYKILKEKIMFEALEKYADFDGRASRKEFWLFFVGIFFGLTATILTDELTKVFDPARPFTTILFLAVVIPFTSVTIRRLHDLDRTGWWILVSIFPTVGPAIILIFACLPGTSGSNRFGPDPLLKTFT